MKTTTEDGDFRDSLLEAVHRNLKFLRETQKSSTRTRTHQYRLGKKMLARSFRSRLRATLHTRAQAATSSSSAQSPFSPPSQVHSPIDFSDSRAVYANKSSFELIRAYAVLKACGIQPLVKVHSTRMSSYQEPCMSRIVPSYFLLSSRACS